VAIQAMVHHLCCQGMRVMAYMDDFSVIGYSHQQALKHTTLTLRLLDQLGCQVNFKKSDLTPSQSKEFLGLLVDMTGPPLFKVPPHKSHALRHDIDCLLCLFRQQGQVPGQKLATVIGQGVALTKAILLAKLLLCNATMTLPKEQTGTALYHCPQLQSWTLRTGTTVCQHGTASWQEAAVQRST